MIVVTRYRVDGDAAAGFLALAEPALSALAARPGFEDGQVGRSSDEPATWVMVTRWESVGAYRRALSSYEVKVHAVPLMYLAIDEPGAFEVLLEHAGGSLCAHVSDLAPGPGGSLATAQDPPARSRSGPRAEARPIRTHLE